jgi:hypothetical protein
VHAPALALVELSTPKGAPWEFLVVFAVLLLGPVLFRRAGIPGIIGLLVGGYAIGPHGLSLIGAGNNTLRLIVSSVPEWLVREETAADESPELPGDAAGV